jgi:hypothetical protein
MQRYPKSLRYLQIMWRLDGGFVGYYHGPLVVAGSSLQLHIFLGVS